MNEAYVVKDRTHRRTKIYPMDIITDNSAYTSENRGINKCKSLDEGEERGKRENNLFYLLFQLW